MLRDLFLWATLAGLFTCGRLAAQRSTGTGPLADDLCDCLGRLALNTDDRSFNLAVKHCLDQAVMDHPAEVLALLHRYPDEQQKAYLLGLLIGGTLERTCSAFPLVKERLRKLGPSTEGHARPST